MGVRSWLFDRPLGANKAYCEMVREKLASFWGLFRLLSYYGLGIQALVQIDHYGLCAPQYLPTTDWQVENRSVFLGLRAAQG